MDTKTCTKCEESKTVDCFSKRSAAKDGLNPWCKECCKKYGAQYRMDNPDKVSAQINKWREANPRKLQERSEKYRLDSPDKVRKSQKKYYNSNLEKEASRGKQWRIDNPEKAKNAYHLRRARKLDNGVFKILDKELIKLYASPCVYCGSREKIHMDHVIPISKGGRHSIGNLVPACAKCNVSKGSKYLVEWKSYLLEVVNA